MESWPAERPYPRSLADISGGKTYKNPGKDSAGRPPATMSAYYMLLDQDWFSRRMGPTLAASWRLRSFEPCRAFCADLVPAVHAFTKELPPALEEPLVCKVAQGLPFDRHFWNLLVGEVLLYAATEIPEIQIA